MEHSQTLCQILSAWAVDNFQRLQRITTHERVEVVCYVFFRQLVVNLQICLEQIFKQLEFLYFSIKCGHCTCEGFGKFRVSTDVVVEFGGITVRRQLVKGQQNLVCFNCRRGVLTAKLLLTRGARLILFS